jgi:general secretion pathway protein G
LLSELTVRRAETELRTALRQIRDALDAYKRTPTRAASCADNQVIHRRLARSWKVSDARSPSGAKIYFLRRVPRDPMHPDPAALPESTWRLRSYESPPDRPAPGKDVFDVFSASERVGLNGVPYREW